ncbi:hypothetical protein L596_010732 [Steinernema carpocapsae]|uniref:Uncharacterized protein n=1 Tax=Steinernema carpocapsae TaxID=34508 RepID=A0A4U5PJ63_STECR|nr:hypothetical protein L596_010732 [Steinernema carpocapsae]
MDLLLSGLQPHELHELPSSSLDGKLLCQSSGRTILAIIPSNASSLCYVAEMALQVTTLLLGSKYAENLSESHSNENGFTSVL